MKIYNPGPVCRFFAAPFIVVGAMYEFVALSFGSGRAYTLIRMGLLELPPAEEEPRGRLH